MQHCFQGEDQSTRSSAATTNRYSIVVGSCEVSVVSRQPPQMTRPASGLVPIGFQKQGQLYGVVPECLAIDGGSGGNEIVQDGVHSRDEKEEVDGDPSALSG